MKTLLSLVVLVGVIIGLSFLIKPDNSVGMTVPDVISNALYECADGSAFEVEFGDGTVSIMFEDGNAYTLEQKKTEFDGDGVSYSNEGDAVAFWTNGVDGLAFHEANDMYFDDCTITHLNGEEVKLDDTASETSGQFARLEENAIYIPDQLPGNVVVVNTLNLSEPGFVAIQESTTLSFNDAYIGSSALLKAGSHRNVEIPLEKGLKNGEVYRAVLFKPNLEGEFDPITSEPVYSQVNTEEPIHMVFFADANATDPRTAEVVF